MEVMIKLNRMIWMVLLVVSSIPSYGLSSVRSPTFLVEHARTEEQIQWGLMQRRELPENQGMLFHYGQSQVVDFWSFNCYIDLSVAFIDGEGVVRDIKTLRAYPEKMDPTRPVLSYRDFSFYSEQDPIVVFFQKRSVTSPVAVKYVLEMNAGWFERNHVQVGDVLHWDDKNNSAFFTVPNPDKSIHWPIIISVQIALGISGLGWLILKRRTRKS